jgi:hypothetical protein
MLVVHRAGTVKIVINVGRPEKICHYYELNQDLWRRVLSFPSIHFKHDAISFVCRPVGAFKKYLILNRSSSSLPPSHFFLNMQLVRFNGNNSLRTNPGDCH